MDKQEIITVVTYTCPVCKRDGFRSPEEAIKCRDKHSAPVEIIEASYYKGDKIPNALKLRWPNGFEGWMSVNNPSLENNYLAYEKKAAQ